MIGKDEEIKQIILKVIKNVLVIYLIQIIGIMLYNLILIKPFRKYGKK